MVYDFTQTISGLTGFVAAFESRMKQYIDNIPVYLIDSGDYMYLQELKFKKYDNNITPPNPRITLALDDVSVTSDNNTNPFNRFEFKSNDIEYAAVVRRNVLTIPFACSAIAKGMILGLQQYEMLLAHFSTENVFTYEYMGNTFEGMYIQTTFGIQKPSLEPSSSQANFITKVGIELTLPLYLPRINTIKPLSAVGFDSVRVDLTETNDNFHQIIDSNESV